MKTTLTKRMTNYLENYIDVVPTSKEELSIKTTYMLGEEFNYLNNKQISYQLKKRGF